jgi:RNA polymerase-associated protein
MPTLADREGVLTGAAVIAEYLDERYPHPKLMPVSPAERARIRMALRHIEQEILPLISETATPDRRQRSKLVAALQELLQSGARRYGSHGWYLGLEFNLVDCLIAVMLLRLQAAELASSPVVAQYAQRVAGRPAFRACFEVKSA